MRVSSFCGKFSLTTGAVIIGLFHLISAPLLYIFFDPPGFRHDQWDPILALLFTTAILLFIGIKRRNVDNVFPFVCLQFVVTAMLIYHITFQSIRSAIWYEYRINTTLILCEIPVAALMMYFLTAISSFYQDLLYERFASTLSIDSNVAITGAQCRKNILNDLEFQQKIRKDSDKEAIIQCEDLKQ